MDKKGTAGLPCTFCDRDAVPGTNPPVCRLHMGQRKEASEGREPTTLKELDADGCDGGTADKP